jgi:molecular chaperone DnaK
VVNIVEPLSGHGRVVITSSTALQVSYESEHSSRDAAEPSPFTRAIVEGLQDGSADLDDDGHVDVHELYSFVRDRVLQLQPKQTPTLSNRVDGSIYLTRNPRRLRPVPIPGLPAKLRDAIIGEELWQRVGAIYELERLLAQRDRSDQQALMQAAEQDPATRVRAGTSPGTARSHVLSIADLL